MEQKTEVLSVESIQNKVYVLRGQQVMLDYDLAEIYGYEVKNLNQQVKRNIARFPEDFMFQLTREEIEFVKSQFVISRDNNFFEGQGGGRRKAPYAFTEQGIYMLATVLRGELAEQQSIFIMRAFREMRHYIKQNQQFVTQSELRLVTAKVSEISVQVAGNVDWKNKAEERFDVKDTEQSISVLIMILIYMLSEEKSQLMEESKMKELIIYVHGKGGNADEAEHYKQLFDSSDIIGFDYHSQNPWEAKEEFAKFFDSYRDKYDSVILIANSIGAFFSLSSLAEKHIDKAYFISPIVNMEKLIKDMMMWANITEKELSERLEIDTDFGEKLSWEYLCYVRNHPIEWNVPTYILYGEKDNLTSIETISTFAKQIGAEITVMKGGEHWFHTDEQMDFLDNWIKYSTRMV